MDLDLHYGEMWGVVVVGDLCLNKLYGGRITGIIENFRFHEIRFLKEQSSHCLYYWHCVNLSPGDTKIRGY